MTLQAFAYIRKSFQVLSHVIHVHTYAERQKRQELAFGWELLISYLL